MEATDHPLAQMSLDFLSAQGMYLYIIICNVYSICFIATSTDVKRAFSRGGLTILRMRHLLSDKSVRVATVVGSWCEFPVGHGMSGSIQIFSPFVSDLNELLLIQISQKLKDL